MWLARDKNGDLFYTNTSQVPLVTILSSQNGLMTE